VWSDRLISQLRTLVFQLKKDPRARDAIRPLVLAILFVFILNYVIDAFYLAPYERKLASLKAQESSLRQALKDRNLYLTTLTRLTREREVLDQKLRRLEFKNRILHLERSKVANIDTFRRILLGIGPGIPHLKSFDLVKIVRQEKGHGGITALQGELNFAELLKYLDYLERRQEVGYLDKLNITEDFCDQGRKKKKVFSDEEKLCFQLVAGREHVVNKEGNRR